MVEDGRLGGTCRGPIVVGCDRMEELRENGRIEVARALLDQPQAEVDVAEEAPLVRRPERRARPELTDSTDIVHQGRR